MNDTQIGVDLAKSVFEVAISHEPGRVHARRRLSRAKFQRFLSDHEPAQILMEACGTGHFWGRECEALGHHVRLLHPGDVARYRDGNKTDRADAKAVLEASRNQDIDAVPVKSEEQQAMTALHRLRQGYLRTRTARINAVRGHLREFGINIPLGAGQFVARVQAVLTEKVLPPYLTAALDDALDEIVALKSKADALHSELEALVEHTPDARLLMSVPGVGVLTATALVAFVGDIHRFRSGRDFAAYLGLTPREHSSGNTRRLGRISKRGNSYLRTMLVHGARSALQAGRRADQPDSLRTWAMALQDRKGHNVAAVGLANKLARICWRVWRDQRPFERRD